MSATSFKKRDGANISRLISIKTEVRMAKIEIVKNNVYQHRNAKNLGILSFIITRNKEQKKKHDPETQLHSLRPSSFKMDRGKASNYAVTHK